MQRSTDRIRTTHVGSLARPPALLNLMKAASRPRGRKPNAGPSRTWWPGSARPGWT